MAELSNNVEAALLDADGSLRDLSFDNPTWEGVLGLLEGFRSTFGRVSIASVSHEGGCEEVSEVGDAVRLVRLRGGFVQLLFSDGSDLLKQLQVFVANAESAAPFIEVTFSPDDWAALPPLADRFVTWASNLRRVLEAASVYARYENASWKQGDVGPNSGVFFASEQ